MSTKAMVILTAEPPRDILKAGGTMSWVLNRPHAKQCSHVLLCQNAYSEWPGATEPHRQGFMIGRIKDVIPSPKTAGRWMITFSAYAVVDMPDAWGKWQNPVRYVTLEELGIDIGTVDFREMPETETPETGRPEPSPSWNTGIASGLSIAEAKQGLALRYGVTPDAVEITIRG
jgi:hypothetical protein